MKTLLLFLSLIVTTSQAASVRLYFTDPLTNDKDTNAFYITPIGTNVLSSGGVVGRGVTTRYVPASNGYRTNTLAVGHYSITNRSLGSGVVIRVPDSSSLYDYTNILISGYNIFVTITNGDSGTTYTNNTGLPGVVLGSGIGTNLSTLATQAGLAAGSYDINTVYYSTNNFFGNDSELLSRGLYIRAAAWEYIPGLGSVDLQSPINASTTNRLSGLDSQYSTIAGGQGNSLSNSLLDQSFNYNFIAGGLNNKMINGDASSILGGVGNYLGPLSDFGAGGEVQSSVIAGGHDNAIFDGHEAFIGCGVGNTNHAAQGFIGAGNRNLIDFSGNSPFIGAGNDNTITNSALAFIGAGAYNRITSSLGASILGTSNIVTFSNSVTLGVNLTNANYTLMTGVGTNFFAVSPNGGVTMRGSGGDTNLLRFTSTTLSRVIDTFYTNIERRAFIQIRINVDSVGVGGDIVDIRLEIDQDGNGSWEETENRFVEADPGVALATQVVLSDYLQPNARYRVVQTNSTGFGGGAIQATRIKYF